jgi:hypothetical protein
LKYSVTIFSVISTTYSSSTTTINNEKVTMIDKLLHSLWYRAVHKWMHWKGAEDIEVEYMDMEYTIPVYPLTVEQQIRLRQIKDHLDDGPAVPGDQQVLLALSELQDLAEEVTEYRAGEFPTELLVQILSKAPKEGFDSLHD